MISPAKYRRIKVAPVLISINTQSCSQVSSQMFLHSIVAQTVRYDRICTYRICCTFLLASSPSRFFSLGSKHTHTYCTFAQIQRVLYFFFFFSLSISLFLHSMVIFFLFSSWHLSSVITKGKSPLETLVSVWPLIHIA